MLSFTIFTLSISYLVKIFHLDPNILRIFAVVVLAILGVFMIIPGFNAVLELGISRLTNVFSPSAGSGQVNAFAPTAKTVTPSSQNTTKGGLPVVTPNQTTTKGGLPVVSPVVTQPGQNTPPTGPEALVLAGLLPTGALGWLLRKKTS